MSQKIAALQVKDRFEKKYMVTRREIEEARILEERVFNRSKKYPS